MNSPTPASRVAGAWGKAFKLPSLYALGHPLVGNPDLVPERGESHELELSQTLLDGAARWSATWFDGEFRNAIDFDSGPPPMLVNRNRVDSHGVELAGQLGVGEQWMLDASVTNAKSRIASTGGELRNRPEWRAGCGAHWAPSAALRVLRGGHVRGLVVRFVDRHGRRATCRAYTRVDVSAVWQVSPRFETYLAIDNLTDEQYEQFVGFEARGIAPRRGREVQSLTSDSPMLISLPSGSCDAAVAHAVEPIGERHLDDRAPRPTTRAKYSSMPFTWI